MTTSEAYLSDVLIVAEDSAADRIESLAAQLAAAGLEVREIRKDLGVIEGTCDHSLVKQFDQRPDVSYVRTVFNYIADYPPGDPRNRTQ